MRRTLGQLSLVALVATLVTLGVNLALLPRLPAGFPPRPAPTAAEPGRSPASGTAIPVALRTVAAQPPERVTLPTPVLAQAEGTAAGGATGNGPTPGVVPCQYYPLSEVLAAFRRADLPLRDSLFDPAYPGTDQPFPITARVRDYARGVAGVPGLRLDVFILPDEAQVRALEGDAGRWALRERRQIRVFPYRNVALVFYEVDPALAIPYEQALVRLP